MNRIGKKQSNRRGLRALMAACVVCGSVWGMSYTVQADQTLDGVVTVTQGQRVDGFLTVNNQLTANASMEVKGDQIVGGKQTVNGVSEVESSKVTNNQTVGGDQTIKKNQTVEGASTVKGDIHTEANSRVDGDQIVGRNQTVEGVSIVKGGQTVTGGLNVSGEAVFHDGLDMDGQKIAHVADGSISADSMEAVNGRQLWGVQQDVNRLSGKVNDLGNEIDHVGAISAALAGLHPLDYDGAGSKFQIAAAMGNYDGTQAAAIGGFYHFNEDVMMSLGGATSFGGDNKSAFNLGVTFRVGQGGGHRAITPDVQAKLDAQDAQIAAQNERIAELTAQVEALMAKDAK